MRVETFACDQCQKRRDKDSNHWFRGYKLISGGVVIIPWDAKPTADDVENFEAHLCGAACATEWFSKHLL